VAHERFSGAPSKYKPEFAKIAETLCALGFTDRQLADYFKVSESTILAWRLKHPEFAEAVRIGKDITDAEVERAVLKQFTGYYVEVEETAGSPVAGGSRSITTSPPRRSWRFTGSYVASTKIQPFR
jgi:hypothetical protein